MGKDFPKKELKLIDLTLRMFIEPTLDLDLTLLESIKDLLFLRYFENEHRE